MEQSKKKMTMRISVSAEVYGDYNKEKDFKPPVFQKSLEEMNKIFQILNQNFIFSNLEQNEKKICALAMREVKVPKNDFIIK